MATIFTHAVVPLMVGAALPRQKVSWRLIALGAACAAVPDLDAITFLTDINQAGMFGHRGFTHSIVFALLLGALAAADAPRLKTQRWIAGLFVGIATLLHPFFDMLTDGGSGVGLLIPFTNQRFRFAWTPITVAPISPGRLVSERGSRVFQSELLWLWLPTLVVAGVVWLFMRQQRRKIALEQS